MKHDHFVSKAYLNSFCGADGRLQVYGKDFPGVKGKHPGAVCKELGGSFNSFLGGEDRIETYLLGIENKWPETIKFFHSDFVDDSDEYQNYKRIVARYLPYLRCIPPSHKQDLERPIKAQMDKIFLRMLKDGMLPPLPEKLKGFKPEELLPVTQIKPGFAPAMVFSRIEEQVEKVMNCQWIHLINETKIPFITSDNPACFIYASEQYPLTYFPLSPSRGVVLSIVPGPPRAQVECFGPVILKVPEDKVNDFNGEMVKYADRIVIAQKRSNVINDVVNTYRGWEAKTRSTFFDFGSEYIMVTKYSAAPKNKEGGSTRG